MYFGKMILAGTEAKGDHLLFNHVQNVAPVMETAHLLRESTNNGWTESRSMQLVGEIPDVVFFNHPEFYNDDKALRRWLNSDEGAPYRVARFKPSQVVMK